MGVIVKHFFQNVYHKLVFMQVFLQWLKSLEIMVDVRMLIRILHFVAVDPLKTFVNIPGRYPVMCALLLGLE